MSKIFANNNPDAFAIVDDDVFEIIKEMKLKFCINNNGYFISTTKTQLHGMTKKKQLLLHHFVWLLKTGEEPMSTVDHIDRNKSNNQFSNLRLATKQEQSQHRSRQKNNTSGYVGVYHKVDKRGNGYRDYWCTRIKRQDGKNESKYFHFTEAGKIEAGKYYDKKAREYFGDFCGELNFPDDN